MRKRLNEQQTQTVCEACVEIMKERIEPISQGDLEQKIYEMRKDLQGYALYKGIELGKTKGKIVFTPYKGYHLPSLQLATTNETNQKLQPSGKESEFYNPVARWFEENMKPCITKQKKGKAKEWGMPDVSVLRAPTSDFTENVELITIEVKRGVASTYDLLQAYGYSKLAHRCYLASDSKEKLMKLKLRAESIGVGLLWIENKKKIVELLSSARSDPIESSLLEHLAHTFDVVRCYLCDMFFQRAKGKTRYIKMKHMISGVEFQRFVCSDCINVFNLEQNTNFSTWK